MAKQKIKISKKDLQELNENGMSMSEIARMLKVSRQRIHQLIEHPKRKPKRAKVYKRIPVEIRFHNYYVKLSSGCWEWKKATHPLGYGRCIFHGKANYAHRVSWILHNGPIPEGQNVSHFCNNPACVNPDHLYLRASRGMKTKKHHQYL